MFELNELNIPAYQRKKSLERKSKKQIISRPRISKNQISNVEDNLNIPINSDPTIDNYRKQRVIGKNNIVEMELCGQIDGYFEKINVVVLKTLKAFRNGDTLIFETDNGLFQQTINSIQQNRNEIILARTGSEIGIKVLRKPLIGGKVYKVL